MRIEIAGTWDDGGDAGADIVAFDNSLVADLDSGYVGDGIQWPGRKCADDEPDVACARSLFGKQCGAQCTKE